ncbi:MAG: hypothetical protein H0W78_17350 [Planctomycetes bacterium]|nr:hypothetical protein [Planctomycetota bacterium]
MAIDRKFEERVLNKSLSLLIRHFRAHKFSGEFFASGNGRILLTNEGVLTFEYIAEVESEDKPKSYKPGELIDPKDLCLLEMTDEHGTEWYVMDVFLRRGLFPKFMHQSRGSAQLHYIETNERLQHVRGFGGRVILTSNKPIDLPRNIVTETKHLERRAKSKAGKWIWSGVSLDKAKIHSGPYELDISWGASDTLHCKYTLRKSNPRFHDRLCETIMFLTGIIPRPVLCARSFGHFETVTIYSHRVVPVKMQRTRVPLQPTTERFNPYSLFKKYMLFSLNNSDDSGWSNLSREWTSIILSRNVSVSAEILATCIAIEWATKSYFGNVRISRIPKSAMRKLLDGIKAAKVSEAVTKRAVDVVSGALSQVRCKDILYALHKRGLITMEMVSAWDKNRNSSAHGSRTYAVTQKQLSDSDALFQLLCLLFFRIIGYKGRYIDYSAVGWPISKSKETNVDPQTLSNS